MCNVTRFGNLFVHFIMCSTFSDAQAIDDIVSKNVASEEPGTSRCLDVRNVKNWIILEKVTG